MNRELIGIGRTFTKHLGDGAIKSSSVAAATDSAKSARVVPASVNRAGGIWGCRVRHNKENNYGRPSSCDQRKPHFPTVTSITRCGAWWMRRA